MTCVVDEQTLMHTHSALAMPLSNRGTTGWEPLRCLVTIIKSQRNGPKNAGSGLRAYTFGVAQRIPEVVKLNLRAASMIKQTEPMDGDCAERNLHQRLETTSYPNQ